MLQIGKSTSLKEISDYIARLRERKGKEKVVLKVIDQALSFGQDFLINILWEQALTYQHLVMNEDSKGEKANKKRRKENLLKMEETINLAKYYIIRFGLYKWEHRLYRFLGRVSDYKGDFKRAINYYKKSIKSGKSDPDYRLLKYPRWLEVEAFLSSSIMLSGQTGKGYTLAETVYRKFDIDKEALFLKEKDYTTWAIWRTGIPARTINILIIKKVTFDKERALNWIDDAERLLREPKKRNLWSNFRYRLEELSIVNKKIRNLKN